VEIRYSRLPWNIVFQLDSSTNRYVRSGLSASINHALRPALRCGMYFLHFSVEPNFKAVRENLLSEFLDTIGRSGSNFYLSRDYGDFRIDQN